MSVELKKAVWDSMLDADMNARYWKYLVERYSKQETICKIFLAVMASGTVAGWSIWAEYELAWKILSSSSALLAIVMPIFNIPKKIESASELAGKWGELRIEYEDMYLEVSNTPDSKTVAKNFKKFRNIEISLEKKESKMPNNEKKLIKQCYEEVIQSRGL
jgi:hypothetical protein